MLGNETCCRGCNQTGTGRGPPNCGKCRRGMDRGSCSIAVTSITEYEVVRDRSRVGQLGEVLIDRETASGLGYQMDRRRRDFSKKWLPRLVSVQSAPPGKARGSVVVARLPSPNVQSASPILGSGPSLQTERSTVSVGWKLWQSLPPNLPPSWYNSPVACLRTVVQCGAASCGNQRPWPLGNSVGDASR